MGIGVKGQCTSIYELEITQFTDLLAHQVIIIQWTLPDYHSINATYEATINNSIGCPPQ